MLGGIEIHGYTFRCAVCVIDQKAPQVWRKGRSRSCTTSCTCKGPSEYQQVAALLLQGDTPIQVSRIKKIHDRLVQMLARRMHTNRTREWTCATRNIESVACFLNAFLLAQILHIVLYFTPIRQIFFGQRCTDNSCSWCFELELFQDWWAGVAAIHGWGGLLVKHETETRNFSTCNVNGQSSLAVWHHRGHCYLQRWDIQLPSSAAQVWTIALMPACLIRLNTFFGEVPSGFSDRHVYRSDGERST